MTMTTMKDHERLDLLKEIGGTKVYEERREESLKVMKETEGRRKRIEEVVGICQSSCFSVVDCSLFFSQFCHAYASFAAHWLGCQPTLGCYQLIDCNQALSGLLPGNMWFCACQAVRSMLLMQAATSEPLRQTSLLGRYFLHVLFIPLFMCTLQHGNVVL